MEVRPSYSALQKFCIRTEPVFLPGGEGRAFKADNLVLKHINKDSEESTNWTANLYDSVVEKGFRIPKPIRTTDGKWITPDGWSAWTFLDGDHSYDSGIDESIAAIKAFHAALKEVERPSFLDSDTPYHRSDIYAWGGKPDHIHEDVREDVEKLYSARKPIEANNQLIHGDLNPDNILLAEGKAPAIIDIAPYWRPMEFALAIYAYWIAAYRNQPELLKHFERVANFKQHLIRAGIRHLLTMSEFDKVHELEKYKKATEIVLGFETSLL